MRTVCLSVNRPNNNIIIMWVCQSCKGAIDAPHIKYMLLRQQLIHLKPITYTAALFRLPFKVKSMFGMYHCYSAKKATDDRIWHIKAPFDYPTRWKFRSWKTRAKNQFVKSVMLSYTLFFPRLWLSRIYSILISASSLTPVMKMFISLAEPKRRQHFISWAVLTLSLIVVKFSVVSNAG